MIYYQDCSQICPEVTKKCYAGFEYWEDLGEYEVPCDVDCKKVKTSSKTELGIFMVGEGLEIETSTHPSITDKIQELLNNVHDSFAKRTIIKYSDRSNFGRR